MANILVHALAATAGGGLTYLRNLLRQIKADSAGHRWTILLPPNQADSNLHCDHLKLIPIATRGDGFRRVLFDQVELAKVLQRESADLLLATGNFGMLRPPIPQVLLSRNALYFSREHSQQLRNRREFKELLRTGVRRQISIRSILASTVNATPTKAFADDIRSWIGRPDLEIDAMPFGFDHTTVLAPSRNEDSLRGRLHPEPDVRRILMVSHYNYFRNFETLLEAFSLLVRNYHDPVELILTTNLEIGRTQHRYDTSHCARLLQSHNLADRVTMLGPVPHDELPSLYRLADVVVCASYAESFGHPMVEAMAHGRPIVASDRSVHREICGPAALYFSTFDPEQLAFQLMQILDDQGLADQLSESGRSRASSFSWSTHYQGLVRAMERALTTEPSHANR